MARKRADKRDLLIPLPENLERRNRALGDVEFFLQTYFEDMFDEPFTKDRSAMLQAIIRAAKYGGDQAIAGPRGEGKTTLAICGALFLMFAGLTHFPIVIGKSQTKSQNELREVVERLQTSDLLLADFPEIAVPFQNVGGWSSRARMQTVGGRSTGMMIKPEMFRWPRMTAKQMGWPDWLVPVSNGQLMGALGIDGPIRGTKPRPTLSVIDDIEDREAANSDSLIAKNEEIIEQDIGGMGRSAKRIPRVFLCTIQNRKCNAFKYTDPKQKPSFNGLRFRKMIKPPDDMVGIQTYIEMRRNRAANDPDAREAFRYWRDRKDALEAGAIVSNKRSFNGALHEDKEPLELSAVQSYYNRVADRGEKAVATEDDNDPPATVGPQDSGITAQIVASRDSGLARRQIPAGCTKLTLGIDLGKRYIHWVIGAWMPGGTCVIIDYGYHTVLPDAAIDKDGELVNHVKSESNDIAEVATLNSIYFALLDIRDKILETAFVDASSAVRYIDKAFVDSGSFKNAAYEFCRQVRGPFYPSKGVAPYSQKTKQTEDIIPGTNLHAAKQTSENVWLYNVDADYWKTFVHEGFLTPTFDKDKAFRKGSISLYHSEKSMHRHYAPSIVGKMYMTEFIEGKGEQAQWVQLKEDDHFLDATAYMCAAAEACGIQILRPVEEQLAPVKQEAVKPTRARPQHGSNRFMRRQGGWVRGARR